MKPGLPITAGIASLCLHFGIASAFIQYPARKVTLEPLPIAQLVKLAPPQPAPVAPAPIAAKPTPPKPATPPPPPKAKPKVQPKPQRITPPKPQATPQPKTPPPVAKPKPVQPAVEPSLPATAPVTQQPPTDYRPVNINAAYRSNPKPAYPSIARRRGWEGVVVLQLDLDKKGHPLRVKIADSSGHSMLDKAAQAAVKRWRFAPATRDGQAVTARDVRVPIQFTLKDS